MMPSSIASSSLFLPSLDKVLVEDHPILSWKIAYDALRQPDFGASTSSLELFLTDNLTISQLSREYDPFPLPSSQTRTDFENRTSSINITASAEGRYDLSQIKEDALWLSHEIKIDEVHALRIVILEWQERSAVRILSGYTEEENISVQKAVQAVDFSASTLAQQSAGHFTANDFKPPPSDNLRRIQLLQLYLSEHVHILRVQAFLSAWTLTEPLEPDGRTYGPPARKSSPAPPPWFSRLDESHENAKVHNKSASDFVERAVAAIEKRFSSLVSGSGWSSVVDSPVIEASFLSATVSEIISIMQLLFQRISSYQGVLPAQSLKSWLDFTDRYNFLENFQLPYIDIYGSVTKIQAFVGLISLQILKLPYTLNLLEPTSQRGYAKLSLLNVETMKSIHNVFWSAGMSGSSIAAPAALAWCVILLAIKQVANPTPHRLEDQLSLDTASSNDAEMSQLTRRPSLNVPTELKIADEALRSLTGNQPGGDGTLAIQSLAKYILDESNMFDVVKQLSYLTPQLFDLCDFPQIHAGVSLLELLRQCLLITSYCEPVVATTLAVLRGTQDTASFFEVGSRKRAVMESLVAAFVHDDDVFLPGLLSSSQTRYPLELLPYLSLGRVLTVSSTSSTEKVRNLQLFEQMASFTCVLPDGFTGYEPFRVDEEANCINLTEDLPLFAARRPSGNLSNTQQRALILGSDKYPELYIPRGTVGYVLDDESKPLLVQWKHDHSPLKYLGLLLSTATSNSSKSPAIGDSVVDREIQTGIIRLISTLLASTLNPTDDVDVDSTFETAERILEDASDDLSRNEDVITVVSDIFEYELSLHVTQSDESNLDLISACLSFFNIVAGVMPNRIWPILGRSSYLGVNGSSSKMVAVVVSSDVTSGQHQVFNDSICIFETLVNDVLKHAISRRTPSKTATSRYNQVNNAATGTTQKLMSRVMIAFAQQTMSLFQWFCALPRAAQFNNLNAVSKLLRTYERAVQTTFCFDDVHESEQKVTAPLLPAAEFIMAAISDRVSHSLINSLLTIGSIAEDSKALLDESPFSEVTRTYLRSSAEFLTRVMKIQLLRETPFSPLEERLSSVLPFFIRLYAADLEIRTTLLSLLRMMMQRSTSTNTDSASFLSHLAPSTGKDFMALLLQLRGPLNDSAVEAAIWDFLTAIASSKQQSLIIFVATGNMPKNVLQKQENQASEADSDASFINIALHSVSQAASLATEKQISTLRFLCSMQQCWPGVTNSMRKHADFLTKCADYLGNLTIDINRAGTKHIQQIIGAHVLVDILSLYMHNMRQMGDTSIVKLLIHKLSYLKSQGMAVPAYNTSLQSNLKRNFEKRFPGCSLAFFKRVGTKDDLGSNYYYDLKFADELLSYDTSWKGSKNGFCEEFARANENYSLVEAQILLMGSWKSLAIQLSMIPEQDKVLQQTLANTVDQCLAANAQSTLTEVIFVDLLQSRAELAQLLLQRLVDAKCRSSTMLALLSTVWDAIKASGQDFEVAFVGNNAAYLRMLLGILLLALQPHTYIDASIQPNSSSASTNSSLPDRLGASAGDERQLVLPGRGLSQDSVSTLLLNIASEVVGKGFCSLAAQVHENQASVLPSDFALVNAIFQSLLKVHDVSAIHTQLYLHLSDSNVYRYALSLFSWSHSLLGPDMDPLIGDLTLSFLRELTSIPQMAESLATEGILSQLDTAPLLNFLRERRTGFGPTDKPTRMYVIWARGVLPLTMNILVAVGDAVAAEVTTFLNGFSNQLNRCATAFSVGAANPSAITLDVAAEAHMLALVALGLGRYRVSPVAVAVAGGKIPELAWQPGNLKRLKEDVELWVNGNGTGVRGKVMPSSEREAALARTKPQNGASGVGNRLEEMVLEELKGALFCLGILVGS